jgi:hypothetical protein
MPFFALARSFAGRFSAEYLQSADDPESAQRGTSKICTGTASIYKEDRIHREVADQSTVNVHLNFADAPLTDEFGNLRLDSRPVWRKTGESAGGD